MKNDPTPEDILNDEAQRGFLDKDLFAVFVEAEVPRKALKG